jgi:hypothetical protein
MGLRFLPSMHGTGINTDSGLLMVPGGRRRQLPTTTLVYANDRVREEAPFGRSAGLAIAILALALSAWIAAASLTP